MNLKKLAVRTVSGLIYAGLMVGALFCGEGGVAALAALFAMWGTFELCRNCNGSSRLFWLETGLDILAALFMVGASFWLQPIWALCWGCVMIARFIAELYSKDENPLRSFGVAALSQLYIALPLSLMVALARLTGTTFSLLAVFSLIWLNDSGAFLVGSALGRHRLFERISPKKSWEGFWGGFVFCIVASVIFALCCGDFFGIGTDVGRWVIFGALVSVFSTWGDLVESLIKRSLHVKDSGNLIPGHGGILDRIDSLLMVMPMAAIYLYFQW